MMCNFQYVAILSLFFIINVGFCQEKDAVNANHEFLNQEEMRLSTNVFANANAVTPAQEFEMFLKSVYGTESNIIRKCSRPYKPDTGSHDAFRSQYLKLQKNVNVILTQKIFSKVTGEQCEYESDDITQFTDVSKDKKEIPTSSIFLDLIVNSSFGKGFKAFSNCIGENSLNSITDNKEFVSEIFYMLFNEKKPIPTSQLFDSYCSVNNIFSQFKSPFNTKDDKFFEHIGKAIREILILTKSNYEFIKK